MDTNRTDRFLVLSIAVGLWTLGLLGLAAWVWSLTARDVGPFNPVIPTCLLIAGFVPLALGQLRSPPR